MFCSGLTEVRIPNSVKSIDSNALSFCENLEYVYIPASVKNVGFALFTACHNLKAIYCEAEKKPDGWYNMWVDWGTDKDSLVQWGCEMPDENIIASGFCGGEGDGTNLTWTLDITGTLTISGKGIMIDFTISLPISTFALTREATELSVAPWSQYADKITNIVLDEGVTSIGSHAFDGCNEVKVVSIPKTITIVGESAFDNCTSLKTIYCEAEKAPEGWDDSWQGVQDAETGEKAEVIWGKTEPKYTPGDVNNDGKLNNQDAIHLLKHVMNPSQYTINQSGDMNGDGKVNNQDAIYLLKHILNPSTYPLKN